MDRPNWLNLEGVATYQISGPVFACPVRAGGQTEAVLVTWSKLKANELNKGPNTGTLKLFHASCRQIRRLANLLANDIYGSELPLAASFLDGLYKLIREIDNGDTWTADRLQERVFCQRILEALMKAVLLPAAGLQRVRIWQSIFPCSSGPAKSHLPSEFVCIDSLTNKEATTAGKKLRCMYEGIRTPASDRYCRYAIARFLHDPHAKWQHPAMLGR